MRILVVEDDEYYRRRLQDNLQRQGHTAKVTGTADEAHRFLEMEFFELVVLDLRLPTRRSGDQRAVSEEEGLLFLREIQDKGYHVPVVVLSNIEEVRYAIKAMREGAVDYVVKSQDIDADAEKIQIAAQRAYDLLRAWRESEYFRQQEEARFMASRIVGRSQAIRDSVRKVERLASDDVSVLIQGEPGVGKELFAQTLHYRNPSRRGGLFVTFNCEQQIDDEEVVEKLFGRQKGSLVQKGVFELADEGTLFLREIEKLSIPLQERVYKSTTSGRIKRVGGDEIFVNVRLVASTTLPDLEDAIHKGILSRNLRYCFFDNIIHIPPLRKRKEDIVDLCQYFLQEQFCQENVLSAETLTAFMLYDWPGNVQELRNALERLTFRTGQGTIQVADLAMVTAESLRIVFDDARLAVRRSNGKGGNWDFPAWVLDHSLPIGDRLQEMHSIEREIAERLRLSALLYGTGEILEQAVFQAFKLIGFTVTIPPGDDTGEIDCYLVYEEQQAIVEIKGLKGCLSTNHVRQLQNVIINDERETGKGKKGILVVNHYRKLPPNERDEPFADSALRMAEELGYSLVTSASLFRILHAFVSGELSRAQLAEVRKRIMSARGYCNLEKFFERHELA